MPLQDPTITTRGLIFESPCSHHHAGWDLGIDALDRARFHCGATVAQYLGLLAPSFLAPAWPARVG